MQSKLPLGKLSFTMMLVTGMQGLRSLFSRLYRAVMALWLQCLATCYSRHAGNIHIPTYLHPFMD
jgi:hypothetical protein